MRRLAQELAERQKRFTVAGRIRSAELRQNDWQPVCGRCCEVNDPSAARCDRCGSRLYA